MIECWHTYCTLFLRTCICHTKIVKLRITYVKCAMKWSSVLHSGQLFCLTFFVVHFKNCAEQLPNLWNEQFSCVYHKIEHLRYNAGATSIWRGNSLFGVGLLLFYLQSPSFPSFLLPTSTCQIQPDVEGSIWWWVETHCVWRFWTRRRSRKTSLLHTYDGETTEIAMYSYWVFVWQVSLQALFYSGVMDQACLYYFKGANFGYVYVFFCFSFFFKSKFLENDHFFFSIFTIK